MTECSGDATIWPTPRVRFGSGHALKPQELESVVMLGMGFTAAHWIIRACGQRTYDPTPVWTINNGCFGFKADLCFDMHSAGTLKGEEHYDFAKTPLDPTGEIKRQWDSGENAGITREYKKTGIPIVTPDGHDDTLEYPLAEVIEAFQSNYFTCGAAYMIAYAMLCGVKNMHLFGFDFSYGDEGTPIEPGRACVEYWLGRATERGVHFHVSSETRLLSQDELAKKGLYGYGFTQPRFELIDSKMKLVGFDDGRRTNP